MKLFLLGIIAFFLFTSLWGLYISIRPPKIISAITPKELGLTYEDVAFKTEDGLNITGWFIPSKKGEADAKTIILLHGYPADKGDILPSLAFLNEQYNLFLFDFRYFGQSQGSYSTAGAREIEDLIAAVKYLKSQGINEVGVWGFSMGGAVALMGASFIPEIKAVISEASYARLDLMAQELYRLPFLDYPLAKLTSFWAKLFLGVDTSSTSPEKAALNIQKPILLIHSKDDTMIPFDNALILQESLKHNSRAEFWFPENLAHGQFDEAYSKKISDFFLRNF